MTRSLEDARDWRIHTDYGSGDITYNRYEIRDKAGVTRCAGLRWRDATRILRALRAR